MEPEPNPYAPPVVDDTGGLPDAPPAFGWRVEENRLMVREESVLPMVDLYSGGSVETMTLAKLRVHCRPLWLWGIPLVTVVGVFWGGIGSWAVYLMGGLIIRLSVSRYFPACTMQAFFERRTSRRRVVLASTTFFLAVVLTIFPMRFVSFTVGGDVFLLLWIVFAFVVMRQMVCRRVIDGWFEIRGVHPRALQRLVVIQEGSS